MVKGRGTGISRKNQNNDGINSFAPEILLIFLGWPPKSGQFVIKFKIIS